MGELSGQIRMLRLHENTHAIVQFGRRFILPQSVFNEGRSCNVLKMNSFLFYHNPHLSLGIACKQSCKQIINLCNLLNANGWKVVLFAKGVL